MLKLIHKIPCLFLLIASYYVSAQELPSSRSIGFGITYGNILQHTPKLTYKPLSNSYNIEFNYTQKHLHKNWSSLYGHPLVGFSATFIDYRDTVLGKAFTIMPTIQTKILGYKDWQLFARFGSGLSLNTNYWKRNLLADTINNYISSSANMYASVLLGLQKQIAQNANLQLGYTLSHISNGGSRKPNYGINLIGAYLALNYRPSRTIATPKKASMSVSSEPVKKQKIGLQAQVGISQAEYGQLGGGARLPIYTSQLGIAYLLKQKHLLSLGLHYEYNGKTAFYLRSAQIHKSNMALHASYVSLVAADEFRMGHFGIPLTVGYYLHNKYLVNTKFMQSFGLSYYPFSSFKKLKRMENIYFGALLKVNKFNADYIQFVVGNRW